MQSAFADEASVKNAYQQATQIFVTRTHPDLKPVDAVLEGLKSVQGKSSVQDLNYSIYILESQAFYRKGMLQVRNSDKLQAFSSGMEAARNAKSLNSEYADSYYFNGLNLARWAETSGKITALRKKDEFKKEMEYALERKTLAGQPGETLDGYGPNRFLGRLYSLLPSALGGDKEAAMRHLKKAYLGAPKVAVNLNFYAEALMSRGDDSKRLGKQLITEMLTHDPSTFNPERAAETWEEFEQARQLLRK